MPMTIGQALSGAGTALGAGIRRGGALRYEARREDEVKKQRDLMMLLGLSGKVSPGSLDLYMAQAEEGQDIDYPGLARHLGEYQTEQKGYEENLKILRTALSNVQNLMGVDVGKITGEAGVLSAAITGKGRRLTKEAQAKAEKERVAGVYKEEAVGREKERLRMAKVTAAREKRKEAVGLKTAQRRKLEEEVKRYSDAFTADLKSNLNYQQNEADRLRTAIENEDLPDSSVLILEDRIREHELSARNIISRDAMFSNVMSQAAAGSLSAEEFIGYLRHLGVDDSVILKFGELYASE